MKNPIFKQYVDIGRSLLLNGEWTFNERTQKNCLVLPNQILNYDVDKNIVPIDTTRKSFFQLAVGELLGYIRGETNAEAFAKLKAKTWFKDSNESKQWLENINRKGENDCGVIYGAVGNNIPVLAHDKDNEGMYVDTGERIDMLEKIYNDLKDGVDDRGEIWSFWSPGLFNLGCIRPCMHTHTFTLAGDTLHLQSSQRSGDGTLGVSANMVQVFVLLAVMAQITNHRAGKALHVINNFHLYEPHLAGFTEQMKREPLPAPTLWINPDIKTLEDLRTWVTPDDFKLIGYEHHDPIKYEMFTGA